MWGLGWGAWAGGLGPGPRGLGQGAWAGGPGPRGLGREAWPGPGGLGLGLGRGAWAWAEGPGPGPGGLGRGGVRTDVRTDGRTDGRTDVRTDGQNIPCILQNIAPLGPLPKKWKKKRGIMTVFLRRLAGFMVTFGIRAIKVLYHQFDLKTLYNINAFIFPLFEFLASGNSREEVTY